MTLTALENSLKPSGQSFPESLFMPFSFDNLITPEPSSLVGFSNNTLIRDAENRDEDSLAEAIAAASTRFYLFAEGKVILNKGENNKILFSREEAKSFGSMEDQGVLLGEAKEGMRIAIPVDTEPDSLPEPWAAYDLRSLLYSGSVSDEDAGAIAQGGGLLFWNRHNQHCGKCGAKSNSAIGGYRRDCGNCGLRIFPRTDPVVIMLTVKDDKCLMGRSPHFPEGWFSTLAGFVEPGETMEDAMRRETFEESGIMVGRVKYHASQPWPFPHSLMLGLYGEAISEEIAMDESELEDCRWFHRDEVKLMMSETHPDGLLCPPNKAISSALVKYWVEA
jgi:NAD+ diphosphatase